MKIEQRGGPVVLMVDFEGPAGTVVVDFLEAFKFSLRSLRPVPCRKRRLSFLVGAATGHGWNVSRAICKWAGLDPDAIVNGPDCNKPDCGDCCANYCGNDSPRAVHCRVCDRKAV